MITKAVQSATAGLQSSSLLFSQTAAKIVQTPTQTSAAPLTQPSSSFPAGGPALQNVSAINQVLGQNPSLTTNLVTLNEASNAYQASANVLRVTQDTQNETLRIKK